MYDDVVHSPAIMCVSERYIYVYTKSRYAVICVNQVLSSNMPHTLLFGELLVTLEGA